MAIPLLWVDETPSTNAYVKEKFLSGEWTDAVALAAHRQTAGRGRLGRTWESEPEQALALSVLVPRALPAAVTLGVGVAVGSAIESVCGGNPAIKWPNDILCNDRKIGGILCEGIVGNRCGTVLGIGLNVAQSADFFAEKGLPYGGSILSETGATVSVNALAVAVVEAVEQMLETLETSGFSAIKNEFESRCVTLEKAVNVLSPSGEPLLCGTARGVDDDGNLLVADEAEKIHIVGAGEVSVRGVYGYA